MDDLIRGIGRGAAKLADGDTAGFMNAVALARPQPVKEPKPAKTSQPQLDKNAPSINDVAEDDRSPLQKLVDRFK